MAMTLHPEVQRKAQAEVDAVVGGDRLPRMADMEHLPYVNAVIKETMRWSISAPLGMSALFRFLLPCSSRLTGVPHSTTKDDVYNGRLFCFPGSVDMSFDFEPGHFIPKGALVIANLW